MLFDETYTLTNGVKIPKLGLGTWLLDNEQTAQAVRDAVRLGYRHMDTAQAYGNEEGVGKGIASCRVPRKELFVTTKVRAEYKDYDTAVASIDESLQKMKLDYLDLVIIHAPQPWKEFRSTDKRYFAENREAWRALEDVYKAGKVRAIGVSNFLKDDLENILSSCRIRPMVNQVLMHISNIPFALIEFCKENGIQVEAYSPIAHGAILGNETVQAIAAKYGVSVARLCLKYDLQLGAVVLPKTANPDHMKSNAQLDFAITADDMVTLKAMEKIQDYGKDKAFPVFAKG